MYTPANPFDFLMSGGFRSYNKTPDKQQSFMYAFNPYYDNGNGQTGQLQYLTTNNQGALRVDIGTGINISANITGLAVTVSNPIAVTGGQIDVNGFSTLTGQVAVIQTQLASLTGTVSSKWQKTKTAGYATVYGAITGSLLVNKVQGYTKTVVQPSFIQLFDAAAAPVPGAIPDFIVSVQTVNNWFIDLAEAGVQFNNGLQIVNSSTPDVYTALGASDFIANVVYKNA